MAEDATKDDGLSKEFDEIVEHADDGAVNVKVRRDSVEVSPADAKPEKVSETPKPEVALAAPAAKPHVSGGVMVLQWLSYAFWGWFGVAMTWLTGVVVAYFVTGNSTDVTATLAYPLAAVIVLFALACVTDFFYARHESAQKVGLTNAIMLVNVVLFVLVAVGAAVTGLFALISMALNTDPSAGTDGQVIAAWTSLAAIVIFGAASARAVFGGKVKVIRRAHWIVMAVAALGMITLSIAGPVVGVQSTKDDRVIEQGLPHIREIVSAYVNENGVLPKTLEVAQQAETSSDNAAMKQLISRKLVRYTANVKEPTENSYYGSVTYYDYKPSKTYYYRLCATYSHIKKASGTYTDTIAASSDGGDYMPYLSIYSHAKGEVCYNLEATTGSGIVYPMDDTATVQSGSTSSSTKQ